MGPDEPTRTKLADGRDLLFFSLPGHTPAPVADRRPLPPRTPARRSCDSTGRPGSG